MKSLIEQLNVLETPGQSSSDLQVNLQVALKMLTSTDEGKGKGRVCTKGVFAQTDMIVSELARKEDGAAGTQHVIITPATIRNALRLPIFHEYPPHPDEAEYRASLPLISYNLARQGTRNENFILRQCLPAGWKLVTGIIGKCLGHKTGSLDQLNLFELRILHALVANRMYDFAGLIFDHLVATISGKARPTYVTFPRFIGLFLQHIGDGYAGEPEDERPCSTMSPRLFSTAPQAGDPPPFPHMVDWSANPYSEDPRPVNFVPIMVQPLAAQHPDPAAQPAGEAQPQPTDETQPSDDATTTADASSSSPERQSPIHHSPAQTASDYTCWSRHGEIMVGRKEVHSDLNGDNDNSNNENCDNLSRMLHDCEYDIANEDYDKFQELFDESPLYNRLRNGVTDATIVLTYYLQIIEANLLVPPSPVASSDPRDLKSDPSSSFLPAVCPEIRIRRWESMSTTTVKPPPVTEGRLTTHDQIRVMTPLTALTSWCSMRKNLNEGKKKSSKCCCNGDKSIRTLNWSLVGAEIPSQIGSPQKHHQMLLPFLLHHKSEETHQQPPPMKIRVIDSTELILPCAINAACAALVDAGTPLKHLAVAICCCMAENGKILLDPSKIEEQKVKAFVYLVFPNSIVSILPEGGKSMEHGILTSVTHGVMAVDDYFSCLKLGRPAASELSDFIRNSFKSKAGNDPSKAA
ncbi:hypothetical protein LXL04_015933 [Taraxacum kok-saghyz]